MQMYGTVNHIIFATSKFGDFKRWTYWCTLNWVIFNSVPYKNYFLFSQGLYLKERILEAYFSCNSRPFNMYM